MGYVPRIKPSPIGSIIAEPPVLLSLWLPRPLVRMSRSLGLSRLREAQLWLADQTSQFHLHAGT